MAVGDLYRVEWFWNIGSELTQNVCHLKETVVCTDDVPAQTVCDIAYNMLDARVGTALFSEETKIVLIKARRIRPATGVPATLIVGTATHPEIHGTGLSNPVPSAAAGLLSFYTQDGEATGRGRMYIPGFASNVQNDGQLIDTALPLFGVLADEFKSTEIGLPPLTGEFKWAVFSRTADKSDVIEQSIAHSNMATQRGRRNFPGIGQ